MDNETLHVLTAMAASTAKTGEELERLNNTLDKAYAVVEGAAHSFTDTMSGLELAVIPFMKSVAEKFGIW
jgi:hypothetical protein